MNRRLSLAALFVLAVGLVAACSGATPAMAPTSAPTSAPVADFGNPPPNPNPADGNNGIPEQPQLIIYNGSLNLEVTDVDAAVSQAQALIQGLGGHIAASNASDSGDDLGKDKTANVTYRIPAERWTDALNGLKGLASRVANEQTSSENVTAQVVDLDARLANLRSTEAALQGIMAKATTITDILKVQQELTGVQGDIESMTAQRDLLSNQAALATLSVSFNLPPVAQVAQVQEGWSLGKEIDSALAALVRILQSVASLLVWLLIVVLPVVLPVAIVLWIANRLYARWRRTHPPVLPQAGGPGQWPPSM